MNNTDFQTTFAKIFGFKQSYQSIEDFDQASENPDNFILGERGFWQYKTLRGLSQIDETDMTQFQNAFIYHFMRSPLVGPDQEAWQKATEVNLQLAQKVFSVTDSPVGYGPEFPDEPVHSIIHCRHCLMLTLLLDTIGTDRRLRVLEIGGGFGNMVRILKSHDLVDNWTIFDLDFVCEAQAHFIKENFPELQVNRNSYDPRPGNINLIDQHHRNIIRRELAAADVLIGTHSWSELPLDDFLWYYDALLPLAEHLLYATQVRWPSPELTRKKLNYIEKMMMPQVKVLTEQDNVELFVFSRNDND